MRRFGLLVCAFFVSGLCSCGSSSGFSGASDDGPSGDAPVQDAGVADGPADAPPTMTGSCDNAGLLAGCLVGQCMLSATGNPLPDGASLTVTQKAAPADLAGDTLGLVLCSIALPAGIATVPNLDLRIALTPTPDAHAVLFQYLSSRLSRVVATSQASGNSVDGLVTAPGDFGATERPGLWSVQADYGLDTSSSSDQESLLRNLSGQGMYNSFYDGTHLFVCNGSRLLIYSGIPANPAVKPAVVVGQPDLDTTATATTSSLFGKGACNVPWSDGQRLVVANQNRVLLWSTLPSAALAPADLVLGQPDFTSNASNNGGVTATTMAAPQSIDSDGSQLVVADTLNNRILVWKTFPVTVDQPPDFVVGQADFATSTASVGATPIWQAWGAALDSTGLFLTSGLSTLGLAHVPTVAANNPPSNFVALANSYALVPTSNLISASRIARTPSGGLAIRDASMRRVAVLKALPGAPTSIDFVLGQPDPKHVVDNLVSASTVSPQGGSQALGAGAVVSIPDGNRLLIYDTPPTYNFEPASRVVGQPGFTTDSPVDYRGISASTLAGPADVAAAGGLLAVADRSNNRVLIYKASDVAGGNVVASVVVGQPDVESYVANLDQQTPSATRMSGPAGVALDGTHLVVADSENHRVLIWNAVPTVTGAAADLVLGQTDFSGRRPNRGRGDANGDGFSDADADGFFYPMGVASDGSHLFVADRLNHRVLAWNSFPTSNGQAADRVIGQPDFTTVQPNFGNGPFKFAANGLNLPTGVALVGTTLWVADTANNRLVRWDNATTTPAPGPVFLGQSSGSSVSNAFYFLDTEGAIGQPRGPLMTTQTSVVGPRGVTVAGNRLYVSESYSNRIHVFDATALSPLGELGQSSDTSSSPNANGVAATSLATPLGIGSDGSTLWVADSANHRLLGYDLTTPPSTGAAAAVVLGQPTFATNGFNQTSIAADGVTSQPRGIALANNKVYVADTSNHRVLVLTTPVTAGQQPVRVYGQPNGTLALANSGGAPSAHTLDGPQGVFADASHLIVADTSNNRVLVYDPNGAGNDASLVLGQADFSTTTVNAGGPSASSMQGPTAAYSDGTSLWVGDTGNHRVLVWRTFPTSNGQPADLVLGQASFSGVLPNRGAGAASASSLAFPSGVVVVNGTLYVADTGNNRVVSFSTPPVASGAAADGVLGQADLRSRQAAILSGDLAHLAGPAALATDGENLYVADRDLGRVVVYEVGTIASSAPAFFVIGSVGAPSLAGPRGIAVERTPYFTSRLYVGDTGDNQVVVVQSVSRLALE
jgi:sugar lactone lactonase YvrE